MMTLSMVVPAAGFVNLLTLSRPPPISLYTVATGRTAPLHALSKRPESWVDFDESGDECVITNVGSSCLEAEISDPAPIDGADEEVRRRSPGQYRNFQDISTDAFKRPFQAPSPQPPPAAAPAPMQGKAIPSFPFFSSGSLSGSDVQYDQQYASMSTAGANAPLEERRRFSPGLARDFSELSNEDFRRPYGM